MPGAKGGYSGKIMMIFVFNLIAGFGAVSMPHAFARAGALLGFLFLTITGLLSYVTVTFIVEAMATANAVLRAEGRAPGGSASGGGAFHGHGGSGGGGAIPLPTFRLGGRGGSTKYAPVDNDEGMEEFGIDEHGLDDDFGEDEDSASSDDPAGFVAAAAADAAGGGDEDDFGGAFAIRRRVELAEMAALFLGRGGQIALSVALVVYLYGDLAIYASVVATTIASFAGGEFHNDDGSIASAAGASAAAAGSSSSAHKAADWAMKLVGNETEPFGRMRALMLQSATGGGGGRFLGEEEAAATSTAGSGQLPSGYYTVLALFSLFVVPLSCFNFEKTKLLQLGAMACRQFALWAMIVVGLWYVATVPRAERGVDLTFADPPGGGAGADSAALHWFNLSSLPELFGKAIYSFMCHHSLPSLVTPARGKKKLVRWLSLDYAFIWAFYLLLCYSAMFAFGGKLRQHCSPKPGPPCRIQDIYLLNFEANKARWLADYLLLFPVFVCGSSYPLIAITLRNNLRALWAQLRGDGDGAGDDVLDAGSAAKWSLLAAFPPILVAALPGVDAGTLIAYTGGYAGLVIMFYVPCALVWRSRERAADVFGANTRNPFKSPFASAAWPYLVVGFASVALAFTAFHHRGAGDEI